MTLRWSILCLCLALSLPLSAQVYVRSGPLDGGLLAGSLGLSAGSYLLSRRVEPLTPTELNDLDPADLAPYNRFATDNWSPQISHASDATLILATVAPISSLIRKPSRSEITTIALMYTEGWFLTFGATNLTKALTLRPRPFAYRDLAPLAEREEPDARFSFFSGHTSLTTYGAFFTAKVLHDSHPNAGWRPWVWAGASVLSVGTAYMRVAAGKHFPTDVLAGLAVGAGAGILVPHLHLARRTNRSLMIFPVSNGLRLAWKF